MPRLKFDREFSHKIDDAGRKKTYPAGWEGLVEDENIAAQAVREGAAVEIKPPSAVTPQPAADDGKTGNGKK